MWRVPTILHRDIIEWIVSWIYDIVVCCTHSYRAEVYFVFFALCLAVVISASRQINKMEFNHAVSWLTVIINVDHIPIYISIARYSVCHGHLWNEHERAATCELEWNDIQGTSHFLCCFRAYPRRYHHSSVMPTYCTDSAATTDK